MCVGVCVCASFAHTCIPGIWIIPPSSGGIPLSRACHSEIRQRTCGIWDGYWIGLGIFHQSIVSVASQSSVRPLCGFDNLLCSMFRWVDISIHSDGRMLYVGGASLLRVVNGNNSGRSFAIYFPVCIFNSLQNSTFPLHIRSMVFVFFLFCIILQTIPSVGVRRILWPTCVPA